jgi:hypothetical protein
MYPCSDGNEAVVAVELLAHRRREVEGEETAADLLGEIRIKVVRVGEGRGREKRTREDDAEIVRLERSTADHSLEHVGGNAGHVIVTGSDAERRFVVATGHHGLVVLVRLEPFGWIEHERREMA